MKKTAAVILFITLFYSGFSQSYKEQLKKVNEFLKTFDNGYYGYLEVKDGYLYDRFKDGNNYCKAKLGDLGKAYEKETSRKVDLPCKGTDNCLFSTFTNQYYNSFSFSQSTDFNSAELITLLNNLVAAYNKTNTNDDDWVDEDFELTDKQKKAFSNLSDKTTDNNTTQKNTTSGNYETALKKLNDYLKTFDNGYYGYIEIKDGYLYDRFASGKYSKSEIKYLGKAYSAEQNKKVTIECNNGKDCVFSTYTDSYHNNIGFSQTSDFNTSELITLLDNLISACKETKSNTVIENAADKRKAESLKSNTITSSSSSSATTTTSGNYQTALKNLNDYLKTFDNGYYGYFEVNDGYIYDRFKAGKYNKFKMEDMEGAVIQEQYTRVIFKCKGDNKCISTDWKENGKEEYTQFTKGSSFNYQELADLINNFRDAYLGKKPSASNNSTLTNNKSREQQAKERQQTENVKTKNKENDDDFDEDWDALEKAAAKLNNSTKEVKESTGTLRAILYDKEIILTDIDNSDPNFDNAKKYIGKKGKTKTYIIPNDDNLTFYGDIYFDGILFKFKKIRIKEVTANENTSSTSSNNNYSEPLKKLNEYLKSFNAETYRDIEVKEGKVYFAFYVYSAKYNSSIDISELKNNTIITIGKSVGSSVVDEVKISCKGSSKCFYSTYSNGKADHFRFFSNSVKDFTKMEQLLSDFIKAL